MATKVLVTGAAGYIGSQLCGYLLRAGYHVIAVDNLMYNNMHALLGHLGDSRFEFYKMDVRDGLSIIASRSDVVIPLAALVGAPLCEQRRPEAWAVNYGAVKELVESLSPGQRVILPNTNSGYGATNGETFCVEEDELNPISEYGRSKCEAEKAVLDHENSVVLRLATVFGSSPRMRMDLMVNDFTASLEKISRGFMHVSPIDGLPAGRFRLYEPGFKRNFVSVRDVSRVFCHFMFNYYHHGVFNVGLSDANLTKMELAHTICDELGLDRGVVVEAEGKDVDGRNYLVSNDKLLSTGFRFGHSLLSGIREVIWICRTHSVEELQKMRNV